MSGNTPNDEIRNATSTCGQQIFFFLEGGRSDLRGVSNQANQLYETLITVQQNKCHSTWKSVMYLTNNYRQHCVIG